jgi:hypothetical protein
LRFRDTQIATFPSAYQVAVADMDNDGRLDVLAVSDRGSRLAWWRAPDWTEHAWPDPIPGIIDLAPADIDGDGRLDLAISTGFAPKRPADGHVRWISFGAKPGEPGKLHDVGPNPNTHRVRWADVDGDGRRELVSLPLVGPTARDPEWADPARAVLFRVPRKPATEAWPSEPIDGTLHLAHGLRVINWDADRADELLAAGEEGIALLDLDRRKRPASWQRTILASGADQSAGRGGASEVACGFLASGRAKGPPAARADAFLATIEPWHGSTWRFTRARR